MMESVLWADDFKFQIVFRKHGCCVVSATEKKEHHNCCQSKVQKPASVIVWEYVSGVWVSATSLFIPARHQQATFCMCYDSVTLSHYRMHEVDWPTCCTDLSSVKNVWGILQLQQQRPLSNLSHSSSKNGNFS